MVSRQQQTRQGDTEPGEFRRICREVAEADYHADPSGRGTPPVFMPEDTKTPLAERLSSKDSSAGSPLANWRAPVVPGLTAVAGQRELYSKNLVLTRRLHDLVSEHPDFEVLPAPGLGPYRFRYVPNGLADRRERAGVRALLDRLNLGIVESVRRCGLPLVGAIRVGGRVAITASIYSQMTTEGDVDAAFEAVARWGRLLYKTHPVRYPRPAETEAL